MHGGNIAFVRQLIGARRSISIAALGLAAIFAHDVRAATAPIDPPASEGSFAPFVAPAAGGVAATWIDPAPESGGSSRIMFARFDGDSWSSATAVASSSRLFANWADTPGFVEGGDGALVAWWLEKLGGGTYAYGIKVARSTDRGATWTELGWLQDDESETEHGFVSGVAEGELVRLFWLDGRATGGEGGAMSLRTALVGDAVGRSVLVDGDVCDCCATAAARAGDRALVAYRDRTAEEIRDILVAAESAEGWRDAAAGADGWEIAGCPVNGPSLVSSGGSVGVAWFTGADERPRVQISASKDAGATFSETVVVDDRAPLGRVGLAPLGEGGAALSWYARIGEMAELRVARIGFGAGGPSVATPVAIAKTSGGRRSGVPRLAALGHGRLLALWTEAGEGPTRLRGLLIAGSTLPTH